MLYWTTLNHCYIQDIWSPDILFLNVYSRNALQWCHNECDGVSNSRRLDCSAVYSVADQREHQSSASLAFVRGTTVDRWIPLLHKGSATRKMFTFDDVIMGKNAWTMVGAYPFSTAEELFLKWSNFDGTKNSPAILCKDSCLNSNGGLTNVR